MCLPILLAVFGIIGLVKGEFKISRHRQVSGGLGRTLGLLLLLGAAAPLLVDFGGLIALGTLVFVILVGLVTSEKIEEQPAS